MLQTVFVFGIINIALGVIVLTQYSGQMDVYRITFLAYGIVVGVLGLLQQAFASELYSGLNPKTMYIMAAINVLGGLAIWWIETDIEAMKIRQSQD
jgi:hypothetical protein